mmetsp:Transcript_22431/g.76852  ORF Transcript_22431/g.76852 Transcript_22431/m.76852 type:complete len:218 (+) Transcript_22431:1226-1879(+)
MDNSGLPRFAAPTFGSSLRHLGVLSAECGRDAAAPPWWAPSWERLAPIEVGSANLGDLGDPHASRGVPPPSKSRQELTGEGKKERAVVMLERDLWKSPRGPGAGPGALPRAAIECSDARDCDSDDRGDIAATTAAMDAAPCCVVGAASSTAAHTAAATVARARAAAATASWRLAATASASAAKVPIWRVCCCPCGGIRGLACTTVGFRGEISGLRLR